MARHPLHSQITAGIIEQRHRHMHAVLEVAFDRLDDRDLVLQHDVEHIPARLRSQAHAIADFQGRAVAG